ncbi:MAG: 50S ribosomal protein L17 [Peptoniphilaceae bacterium]|nr:50S ribosomal protein L17 [Peptoniphilaceae bacterium]MCI6659935.1 50S ribosomal protein L17 [Peptoniphilaceae bacterium]MDD7434407.1 50S ribosomal protein L17 [Peptoniphilaceae bacterium]MDD7543977.1 50S ribosomal protein L17 [Peptoniphilaceae bacterium]MDY3076399.1 50S ribosomal protein L17 [Peptoniphilaceae bacterium]
MANQRKLGRRTDHRSSMLRNQVASLLLNGKITTTVTRAKETQRVAEKLITTAKKQDLSSKRAVSAVLYQNEAAKKLVEEIAPKYADRKGGYTRILKLGPRRGDGSEMAILQLV